MTQQIKLMVPTIYVDAIVAQPFNWNGKPRAVGELVSMAYGTALQMRVVGLIGAFQDELAKHTEATESLQVYGGDSWFPQHLQTISHVADYLAQAGAQPSAAGPN